MRMKLALFGALSLVVASLAAAACRSTAPAPASNGPATLSSAPVVASPSLKVRMAGHAAHGAGLRDAIARADLEAVRARARALAELRPEADLAPTLREELAAMNVAAERVAKAEDLSRASRGLGALTTTCSDCHATLGGPASLTTGPTDDHFDVLPPMKRHEWAAARLWDGLIGPSDLAWKAGIRVLVDAPLEPEPRLSGQSPVPAIGELARSVHDLAASAGTSKAAVDRTAVFGELMATCAACHQHLPGGR